MRTAKLLAAFSASLGLLAAAPVRSAMDVSPFSAFQTVCLAPNADFAGIKAATSTWLPTEVTGATTLPGVTVSDQVSKRSKADGIPLTLFAWTGTTKAGVHVSGCTVRVTKPDFDELQTAAGAYAGFAPQDVAPKKAVFRYTSAAGKPAPIDKTGFDAAASGEGMDILTVSGDVRGAVLDLLKIKK